MRHKGFSSIAQQRSKAFEAVYAKPLLANACTFAEVRLAIGAEQPGLGLSMGTSLR